MKWEEDQNVFACATDYLDANEGEAELAHSVLNCIKTIKNDFGVNIIDTVRVPHVVGSMINSLDVQARKIQRPASVNMFIGSLAPGGAERITSQIFKRLSGNDRFREVELSVTDLHSRPERSHYLSELGALAKQVHELPTTSDRFGLTKFMPGALAARAESIRKTLVQRRPDIAHFSLDFINIAGGVAAVQASVPRIVLHVHNMRPNHIGHTPFETKGWKEIYRALLERECIASELCSGFA